MLMTPSCMWSLTLLKSEHVLEHPEKCIEEIRVWMNRNYLKLNGEKTEFVIFGTKSNVDKVTGWSVTVGDAEILPSTSARNIGVYLDSHMDIELSH